MINQQSNAMILALAAAVAVPIASHAAPKKGQKSKPLNIIYIMADDHSSQAIGAYNSYLAKLNPTPTLDALAEEGVVFDNVFCGNSISAPSRATIMTGQYSHSNSVLTLDEKLNPRQQHLAREMKSLGYQTAIIGKWHLGCEPSQFDYYSVLTQAGEQGVYFDPLLASSDNTEAEFPNNTTQYEGHSTDIITDITIDWIDNKRDEDKPFFVMHHYKAPHGYFEYHPRYEEYLADDEIPVPETLLNREGFGSIGTRGKENSLDRIYGTSISDRNVDFNYVKQFGFDLGDDEANTIAAYNKYVVDYLRCIKGIDDNLARLFQHLQDEGLWDSTVIVYTSDQGMMLGEHDLTDKRWMYEESLRMPFIMRVPGATSEKGSHSDLMIQNVDFAPTLLALAGADRTPEYMQGDNFSGVFFGDEPKGWREAIYYRYWMHMIHQNVPAHFGIRTKEFKLIFFYGRHHEPHRYGEKTFAWRKDDTTLITPTPPSFELYDLRVDPFETTNVAENPEYAEVLEQLKEQLLELKLEVGDCDATSPEILEVIEKNFK